MEEYLREDRLASIKAKLNFLIHHLDPRIHNDSLMEQGVLPYQGSLNLTFRRKKTCLLLRSIFLSTWMGTRR